MIVVRGVVQPLAGSTRRTSGWAISRAYGRALNQHSVERNFLRKDRFLQSSFFIRTVALASTSSEESKGHSDKAGTEAPNDTNFCIVNFYHLVDIENPRKVAQEHKEWIGQRDIKGRIYLSSQGINAQYSGVTKDATAYACWVERQDLFKGLRWSQEPCSGHVFPRLRLQYKPNLVQLKGGMAALPITNPMTRATQVKPGEWKKMLSNAKDVTTTVQGANKSKGPVVLDVRNSYEWDAGHFEGAQRPQEECFWETPIGNGEADIPEQLKDVDLETPVMMYCTGGIRCDVYSSFLQQKGFKNLYTLEGGVHQYFKEVGNEHWKGSLFVFDGRMAVPPKQCDGEELGLEPASLCELCQAPAELPHLNCANIDCNKLFIACEECKIKYKGCCCQQCIEAPRLLRPARLSGQQYGRWGNYAVMVKGGMENGQSIRRRGEGHKLRKQRHLLRLKAKRKAQKEERMRRKLMIKAAMEQRAQASEKPVQKVMTLGEQLARLTTGE